MPFIPVSGHLINVMLSGMHRSFVPLNKSCACNLSSTTNRIV